MDTLQSDLEAMEKENIELKERAKSISKKALLVNLEQAMSSGVSNPPTPTYGTSLSSSASEVAWLECQLNEKNKALKWADKRIRQLKARETVRLLSEMGQFHLPNDICGPLTLAAAQKRDKDDFDKIIRESESLQVEARKYQLPYIIDLTKPKSVWQREESEYYAQISLLHRRIDDLRIRLHKYSTKHANNDSSVFLMNTLNDLKNMTDIRKLKGDDKNAADEDKFRTVYSQLFGNLEAERAAFEEKRKLQPPNSSLLISSQA
ncbi:hypothetical protein AB6A40_007021 [Gnathostoma spinigerum]|uniref:Uncharacterized protein n=1 Tax=Gnathostoma spinigerum TaxID=75299 RepID=A0ABD6EUE9_9BILA